MDTDNNAGKPGFMSRIIERGKKCYAYFTDGVWADPRNNLGTRIVKTLNLTLSAFFNSSLQNKSMSLTYSTVLSIVPAFALLVAIGRGFGLQDLLQKQLYQFFPSQGQGIKPPSSSSTHISTRPPRASSWASESLCCSGR